MDVFNHQLCFVLKNKENYNDSELISKYKTICSNSKIDKLEIYKLSSLYLMIIQSLKSNVNNEKEPLEMLTSLQQTNNFFKKNSVLNCIFKKEDNSNSIRDYKRIVMSLELKNNHKLVSEYKEIHRKDKIWPEIIENMDTIGILNMSIYLYNYRAFLIMDTHLNFNLEKDGIQWAHLPKEKEWQAYVAKFQKVNPISKATEKWQVMTPLI